MTVYGTTLNLNVNDRQTVEARVVDSARREGVEIISIRPIGASLEDVFSDLDSGKKEI